MVRVLSALVGVLVLVGAAPFDAARHPIHSTLADVTYDPVARVATVRVRAFADDFGTATARWDRAHRRSGAVVPDSTSFDYLRHALSLELEPGVFARFEWCGVTATGAVVWLCVRARLDRGLVGVRFGDRILNDLFDDEINIVQVEHEGRRTSAVFTRTDAPRVLIPQAER